MTSHTERVQSLLEQFEATGSPGPAPWVRRFEGGRHDRRVVIGCLVHGNEVGSVPGALEVLAELGSGALAFGGTLDVFLGNPAAALKNTRLVEADLNRVFVDTMPDSLERRRAIELEGILTGCDLFVDLHQTGMPTETAFWTLPWIATEANWVRALGRGLPWITRPAGTNFAPGTCCTDEFVRNQGRPGLTLELGTHGFDDAQAALAATTIRRALAITDAIAERGDGVLDEAAAAEAETPLWMLTHAEPCPDRTKQLAQGTHNFQSVRAGQNLAADGTPDIVVPHDGVVMFPKFPPADQPLPQSLYRLAERMNEDPAEVWV